MAYDFHCSPSLSRTTSLTMYKFVPIIAVKVKK